MGFGVLLFAHRIVSRLHNVRRSALSPYICILCHLVRIKFIYFLNRECKICVVSHLWAYDQFCVCFVWFSASLTNNELVVELLLFVLLLLTGVIRRLLCRFYSNNKVRFDDAFVKSVYDVTHAEQFPSKQQSKMINIGTRIIHDIFTLSAKQKPLELPSTNDIQFWIRVCCVSCLICDRRAGTGIAMTFVCCET